MKVMKVIFSIVILLTTTSCFRTARQDWFDFAEVTEEEKNFLNELEESGDIEKIMKEFFLTNYGYEFPVSISNVEYFCYEYPVEQITEKITDMIEFDVTIDMNPAIERKFYATFDEEKKLDKVLFKPNSKIEQEYINKFGSVFLLEERIVGESLRIYYDKLFFGKLYGYDHYVDGKVILGEKIYATLVNVCLQENKKGEILHKYTEGYFDNVDENKQDEIINNYVDSECLINGEEGVFEIMPNYLNYTCSYNSNSLINIPFFPNSSEIIFNSNYYNVIFYPTEYKLMTNKAKTAYELNKINNLEFYIQELSPLSIRGCYSDIDGDNRPYKNYSPLF